MQLWPVVTTIESHNFATLYPANRFWSKSFLKNMRLIKVWKQPHPLHYWKLIRELCHYFWFTNFMDSISLDININFQNLTSFNNFFFSGGPREETLLRDGNGGAAGEKLFHICICFEFHIFTWYMLVYLCIFCLYLYLHGWLYFCSVKIPYSFTPGVHSRNYWVSVIKEPNQI